MPTLAENNVYLAIGGTVVHLYFKDVEIKRKSEEVDVTGGAGVDHTMRAPGLLDTELKLTLQYDITALPTYIQKIAAGQIISIEYGPESNVSGKPRHVQDFLITETSQSAITQAKPEVTFSVSGMGSGAPSVDMFAGGVYS
jgi:hypothetical protein